MRRPSRGVLDGLESEGGDQAQRAHCLDAATEALDLFDEDLNRPADLHSRVAFRRGDEAGPQERELPSLPGPRAARRPDGECDRLRYRRGEGWPRARRW